MYKITQRRILSIAAISVSSLFSLGAVNADYQSDRYASERYESSRYSSGSDYIMADVIRSEPLYKTVTVSRPERVCEEVEVYERDRRSQRRARHRHRQSAGGTIAGGILGGVIGRQIGKGSGRDAATIAGVLIGSAIGHDKEVNDKHRRSNRYADRQQVRTEQRCRVNTERYTEERPNGYKVTYYLNGKEFTTRTRQQPGKKIRVRITAQPATDDYSGQDYYQEDSSYEGEYEGNYEREYEDYDY